MVVPRSPPARSQVIFQVTVVAGQFANVPGQFRAEDRPPEVRMQNGPRRIDDPAQMAPSFSLQAGNDGLVEDFAGKRLVPLAGQDGLAPFMQLSPDGIADGLTRLPFLPDL